MAHGAQGLPPTHLEGLGPVKVADDQLDAGFPESLTSAPKSSAPRAAVRGFMVRVIWLSSSCCGGGVRSDLRTTCVI